jgi:surface antigen
MSKEKRKALKKRYQSSIKITPRVKEGIAKNRTQNPSAVRKQSKIQLNEAKQTLKLKKQNYQNLKLKLLKDDKISNKKGETISTLARKKAKYEAKLDQKVAKQIYKQSVKDDPTMLRNKAKSSAKMTANFQIKLKVEEAAGNDDTLAEPAKIRQNSRRRTQTFQSAKFIAQNTHKMNIKVGKNTYGLLSKTKNFTLGRGFNVTPEAFSKSRQLARTYRNFKQRLSAKKAAKVASKTIQIGGKVIKIANAPLKTKTLLVAFPIVLLLGFVFGITAMYAPQAIYQDEFELTNSWINLTKQDAEHSDTSNVFFTPLDDVMFYMNYRFEDYALDEWVWQEQRSYAQYLNQLWTALNGKKDDYQTKTLSDLISDQKSDYYISSEDREELRELREEVGYVSLDGQLSFPFPTDALLVSKRFGYERFGEEIKLFDSIVVNVTQGQNITSPMYGTIHVLSSSILEIASQDEKLTVTGVTTSRFVGNEKIAEGALLGQATANSLMFHYEKKNEQDKWETVNPAFYFPKVTYLQFTILGSSNFKPNAEMAKRAKALYDYLTKLGYTRAGIAAVLGNFEIESSINPKRAEGDYLPPPVGASENSWDDEVWLNMGGMAIYGKYPNILHRGLGFGQWTDTSDGGTRHTLLREFAKINNKKWYDLELQLDFILKGDSPANQTLFKQVVASQIAATVPELTTYFLTRWEGNPGDKLEERIQAAINWYQYFSDSAADLTASSKEIFEKYKDQIQPLPTDKETKTGWSGNGYIAGNCTWYCYNRMKQLGKSIDAYMGNANQWVSNYSKTPGAKLVNEPKRGDIAIFTSGAAGSSPLYGHVAIIEHVNSDGTFVISEMNVGSVYQMGWRVLKLGAGVYFMRVN